MRTTGNGCISGITGVLTGIVSETTLDWPFASTTRSWTTWGPAVEKEVLIVEPPVLNTSLPVRAQPKLAIAVLASVEVETSEIASPVCGAAGNHVKEAAGGDGFWRPSARAR